MNDHLKNNNNTQESSGKKGSIQVKTKDIFPIIKKWLYSEHDIFVRELVSNATDAISKRQVLSTQQNISCPEGAIKIELDAKEKTISFIDNGLGMSADDVEKYLAQLAFSGAQEFIEKMSKDQTTDSKHQIIGKFGLGFYSVFMVAKKVHVESLSMKENSVPCLWVCEGDPEYLFLPSQKQDIGTKITLFLNDESLENFNNFHHLAEVLRRYCDFMPYPIELTDVAAKSEQIAKNIKAEKEEDKTEYEPTLINDLAPLWKKNPTEVSDEEYKNFYQRLFPMEAEPLFWIHLNIDHPFHLQGILYFPKINTARPVQEKAIKLYNKQVFVSDQIKDIIPEFLSLLKGTIDSSDIPLNVSRSALQGDPNVKKISNYIIKKVAESLKKLFDQHRERYQSYWQDLSLFTKYGVMSDEKFDDIMRECLLFKNSSNNWVTLNEYKESIPADWKELLKNKILYTGFDNQQEIIRKQTLAWGLEVIDTDQYIDVHLMQHLEMKAKGDPIQFSALDNEYELLLEHKFKVEESEDSKENVESLKTLVTEVLKDYPENSKEQKIEIQTIRAQDQETCAYLKTDQQMKKWEQMSRSFGGANLGNTFSAKKTLVLNTIHPLVVKIMNFASKEDQKPLAKQLVHHLLDLAKLSSEGLDPLEKADFIGRSQKLVEQLSSQISSHI